jgi:hypothetical protein
MHHAEGKYVYKLAWLKQKKSVQLSRCVRVSRWKKNIETNLREIAVR